MDPLDALEEAYDHWLDERQMAEYGDDRDYPQDIENEEAPDGGH